MTGGEIVVVGNAVEAVGRKALAEDEKTKEVLLRVAEDSPEMRAAARSMAARVAVTERVKLKLYQPFARMVGVSKVYFEDTFPQEMADKIANIPEENLITPAASVAVPALQGLSYTFEEPDLKDLYLNLLATASDDRRMNRAHPSFADIIKQLSSAEAKVLNDVFAGGHAVPVVRIKEQLKGPPESFEILLSHLLPYISDDGKPIELPQGPMWIDNWQRLGLVRVTYKDFVISGEDSYDWVESRPEYIRIAAQSRVTHVSFDKGALQITDFGRQFNHAVQLTGSLTFKCQGIAAL